MYVFSLVLSQSHSKCLLYTVESSVKLSYVSALKSYADAAHDEFLHQCDEELVQTSGKAADCDVETSLMELSTKNMDTSNGVSYSKTGHSHGHGHAHSVPNSVSAVAWMVILGKWLTYVVVMLGTWLSY